ncbi:MULTISPECIES: sigma-54 dependent transcriptional regulator [Psychrobacter]|uniref:sigma-54-dependent transcriptional regulator n=1 Tax=Psychrobacter TaxID=497 RepID=UPI00146D59BF|nr:MULTISPECIES: sigma-54 dependent transcriptional regulator [Psychrobacter]
MTARALVVDDEVDLCRLMQITLTKMGIKSDIAYSLEQARTFWQSNSYDFCLTDLRLPDGSGLDLVKDVSRTSSTPIAVITAHGSMDLAIEALKLGAFDFVNKPLELPRLRLLVENALKVIRQDFEPAVKQKSPEQAMLDERLIGQSKVMSQLKRTILKLARSQAPVFLAGASGTGKEVVAKLIHDLSPRRDGAFVPVNCGAIPSELMESEFFGHKKGSFTGAVADKQGLFQQANGGTLFLDEVADLPLAMQVKLLRAIQEKTVRVIGDTREVAVDIRILSATHKDLNQLVQSGAFRQDLYYRINVIEVKLPALNARCDDIPALAQHFLALIAKEWQLDNTPTLTKAAFERLQQHDFAGNVRELRNILERAITMAETDAIDAEQLGLPELPISEAVQTPSMVINDMVDPVLAQAPTDAADHPYRSTIAYPDPNAAYPQSLEDLPLITLENIPPENAIADLQSEEDNDLPQTGLEAYLQAQEKQLIIKALKQTDGNKTQAAELLGTTFRSLRYRMKKLDIDEDIKSS